MNKTFAWVIGILLVVAAGVYFAQHRQATPLPPVPQETVADYYCQEGTIIATFGTSSVKLNLSDGQALTLPQTVSASGIRYEQGTVLFASKGNQAFLQENGTSTYSNCVAGTQASANNTNIFTDGSKTFSFVYPNSFTLSGGELGYTQSWRQGTTDLGMMLAVVTIPRSFQPQTNFSEAKFTVGTSSDVNAVAACLTDTSGNSAQGTTTTINGVPYTVFSFGDAGAGNFYQTTSYRTVRDGQCYAIEYTVHSTNIGNYPPEQHITAFDEAKVKSALEGIVRSFKFL